MNATLARKLHEAEVLRRLEASKAAEAVRQQRAEASARAQREREHEQQMQRMAAEATRLADLTLQASAVSPGLQLQPLWLIHIAAVS